MSRSSEPAGPGFSLVEVVVALAIMLILLPMSTPLFDNFIRDSREAALRQRLVEIRRAIRLFYEDNRRFPNMLFDQYGNQVDFLDNRYSELVQGIHKAKGQYPTNRRRYLAAIPVDPFSDRADWNLIQAPPSSESLTSRRQMLTVTSTRQIVPSRRGLGQTTATMAPLDNIEEIGAQVQVMDVKSRTTGYESL